jgi:hypothetical protein
MYELALSLCYHTGGRPDKMRPVYDSDLVCEHWWGQKPCPGSTDLWRVPLCQYPGTGPHDALHGPSIHLASREPAAVPERTDLWPLLLRFYVAACLLLSVRNSVHLVVHPCRFLCVFLG